MPIGMLTFLTALSVSVLFHELFGAFLAVLSPYGRRKRLDGMRVGEALPVQRRSLVEALLVVLFPTHFDPDRAKNLLDVVAMIRRAGYPVASAGEFYAGAVRTFSVFLFAGALAAGALAYLGFAWLAPLMVLLFCLVGLRRPYARLKTLARKRAEATRNNMLVGLATLNSLLTAGMGVQEAMRRAAQVGGAFCNLMGFLVARMEIEDFSKAVEVVRAHLPDPRDVEVNLFLRDVEDFFVTNRPLLASTTALQEAIHRGQIEATEARASLVRHRSGLFGIFSVIGLVLAMISPMFAR